MSLDSEAGTSVEDETISIEVTESAEEALRTLAERNELTAGRVVEEARAESSPLHGHFDWNDTTAAHAHRLAQARALIRSVRIEVTVHEHVFRVPRYVHDPDKTKAGGGYTEAAKVATDREKAQRVMREELARVRGSLDRAARVAAALGLGSMVSGLSARVNEMQEALGAA